MNTGLRLASSLSRATRAHPFIRPRIKRNYHQLEQLPYPIENGLGEFLPPAALKVVAIDYQAGLLQQLNEELRESEEPIRSVTQTVLDAAQYPEKSLIFNYASLAINNDFFLRSLKPPPPPPATDHQAEISTYLASAIRSQHGSLAQLKSSFCATAMGMFTSGWVWFVTDKHGNTGVIPTFGPGTPLVRSRSYIANARNLFLGEDLAQIFRGDPVLPYIYADEDFKDHNGRPMQVPPRGPEHELHGRSYYTDVGTIMPQSVWANNDDFTYEEIDKSAPQAKAAAQAYGEHLTPLFCVSVNEHAWMAAGYGVWGKEEWLKKFWTVIDWRKVSSTYVYAVPQKTQ